MPYQACFKGLGIYLYWVNYYAVAYYPKPVYLITERRQEPIS